MELRLEKTKFSSIFFLCEHGSHEDNDTMRPSNASSASSHTSAITWMSASGFSRLRISAASCCLSSSTMEAKVTGEEGGGLPTAPSTHGLRSVGQKDGEREKERETQTDRQDEH